MPAATRRRLALVLGGIVVLAGFGLSALGYQRFDRVDVEGKAAAFEILDDQTVSVSISVTRKDPAVPVVCIARAKSRDGAETGRREVLVGPSTDRTIVVDTTVKSYARPAVGDVYGCGTQVPDYLVAP